MTPTLGNATGADCALYVLSPPFGFVEQQIAREALAGGCAAIGHYLQGKAFRGLADLGPGAQGIRKLLPVAA